jgi:hypothetical protein
MKKIRTGTVELFLIILEAALIFFLLSFLTTPVSGGIGNPNATVITELNIGEVYPEILNVSIDYGAETITLSPNTTKTVYCIGLVRDYNGEGNLSSANGRIFHNTDSGYEGAEDNNTHYRNVSCSLINETEDAFGITDDEYHALINCTFEVWYYADPGVWNCTLWVNDTVSFNNSNSDDANVSDLLALEVPDTINYGTVNATDMSNENMTNITNVGNVIFNLSFAGYAVNEGDGLAMNCTLGSIKNISIEHEKFNLTASNPGVLTLDGANNVYENLTANTLVRQFNLDKRTNNATNDIWNATYWRIYVPTGVAGSCQGNIIFGAVQSGES